MADDDKKPRNGMIDDQAAIIDTINRFVRAVDLRDAGGMEACLNERIAFDYAALGADMPSERGAFVTRVLNDQMAFRAAQHMLTNHVVDFDGIDRAYCTTNYRASHWLPGDPDGELWELAGRYDYRLERAPDRWRITGCKIHVAWTTGNARIVAQVCRHSAA